MIIFAKQFYLCRANTVIMIQRVQSVYLFLASLAMFALYLVTIANNVYLNSTPTNIKVTGLFQDVNGAQSQIQPFVALTAVTALVALVPLAIIFFFRNRKRQITLCYSAILVIIGHSFWLAQTVKKATDGVLLNSNNFGVGLFIPPIAILLILLAIKSIKKDEALVKSADRLR
jgi:ABC-type proline/glycine betaine transport system permease subunit